MKRVRRTGRRYAHIRLPFCTSQGAREERRGICRKASEWNDVRCCEKAGEWLHDGVTGRRGLFILVLKNRDVFFVVRGRTC